MSSPAFISDNVWNEWLNLEKDAISRSYFQPVFQSKQTCESQNEVNELLLLKDIIIRNEYFSDKEPKCWDTTAEAIEANNWSLSAGLYKPFALLITNHVPPVEIINELKSLELEIQKGLNDLLLMLR